MHHPLVHGVHRRRLCDDLDLKEISMPRSFFWDDWTNTQDEKHILNLLEDGTLKLTNHKIIWDSQAVEICWNHMSQTFKEKVSFT